NIVDSLGTWGLSMNGNNIFLSYICTPGVPFYSNWTGVKIITYSGCNVTGIEEVSKKNDVSVYPVPNSGSFVVEPNNSARQMLQVYDISGKLVLSQYIQGKTNLNASNLSEGV